MLPETNQFGITSHFYIVWILFFESRKSESQGDGDGEADGAGDDRAEDRADEGPCEAAVRA